MAGSPAKIRLSSLMHQRRLPPKMQMPLLVKSSITINGRKFTTTIHEGASAEELIAKVAKENGGGVAKVYYPEFNTHEIVAVKIGDQMIVKGDPSKVNEGDFSEFADSDSVRRAAVAASSSSKGGIHFFVGRDGIPMAAAEDQGIVFPNAKELRVNTNINNLSLAVVDYNVDPNSIRDINKLYKKGANISLDAKREIEKSHGGVRSEKLMLPDTSVLILSRESGDIRTASEFASNFRAQGFIFKPANARQLAVPQQAKSGLQLPTDLGVMHVPMDGSPFKIPYVCIRVFDGRLTDAIKVRTNPPPEPQQEIQMTVAGPEPVDGYAAEPEAILVPEEPEKAWPQKRIEEPVKIRTPRIETILSYFNCPRISKPEMTIQNGRIPLPMNAPSREPEPAQLKEDGIPKAILADSSGKKKTLKEVVHQKLSKSRRRKIRKPEPDQAKRKPQKEKSGPKKARKKKADKKPVPAKAKKKTAKKPAAGKGPNRKKTGKAVNAPKPSKPKKTKLKSQGKKSRKKKKSGNELVKISTDWSAKKSKMSKKKKKKIQSYYLNTMLGLFKSKRSGAKSSRRKRKASRT